MSKHPLLSDIAKSERRLTADVNGSAIRFVPGDRILVRTPHRLDRSQTRQLKKAVQKWVGLGDAVEILVICTRDVDVEVERAGKRIV